MVNTMSDVEFFYSLKALIVYVVKFHTGKNFWLDVRR